MFRFSFAVAMLAAAWFTSAAPAQAHAILMDSQPASQAAIPPGPATINLKFNSRVDHARSRIALRANGIETMLPIDPASAADALAATSTLTPGDYVVRWQVLAVDGHITRGEVPFTVATPVRTVQAPDTPARSLQTP